VTCKGVRHWADWRRQGGDRSHPERNRKECHWKLWLVVSAHPTAAESFPNRSESLNRRDLPRHNHHFL